MASAVVLNPILPYWGPIPGNLFPGKVISIKGLIPVTTDPSSYSQINLCEGSKEITALHVSIRFNHCHVVRNTHKCGRWDSEEKDGAFPFEFGSEFWIQITVQQDAYHISVNGQHCWTFSHRMPFNNVNTIELDGPFQIFEIGFRDQNAVPGPFQPQTFFPRPGFIPGSWQPSIVDPGFCPATCRPLVPQPPRNPYQPGTCQPVTPFIQPVYKPPIPFNQIITGGIQPGMMFYISGLPSPNFNRFTINFQCGTALYPPPDIAFHFDVRAYNASIVRNTRRDNNWGEEETIAPNFPFQPNVPFDMIVFVQNDKYMVAINGQHFTEYRHRMTHFPYINTLNIENDVVITSIRFAR